MSICEDAPCCGCCGTNIYGQYQGEGTLWAEDNDFYDREDDWGYDDEVDPSDCEHGDCSWNDQGATCALCGTEGGVFFIMGEARPYFPVTKVTQSDDYGMEDAWLDGSYED